MLEDIDLIVVIPTMMSVFLSYECFRFIASPSFLGVEILYGGQKFRSQAKNFTPKAGIFMLKLL
jgi:hypothetical protein